MAEPSNASRAGGALLAAGIIGGALIGTILGQPSIGFLVGTGLGLLLLILVWVTGRKR